MKIFVASWFFPPTTSSEGIVTYKLLRNSSHTYDVFCSGSRQWSYSSAMGTFDDENITVYTIETDDIDKWVRWCVKQFESKYEEERYECIMTRSTPPESILVGREIKKRHPEIKWIASLADPVANNPYELKAYIDDSTSLTIQQKEYYKNILKRSDLWGIEELEKRPESGIQLLAKLKKWEQEVLSQADLIISPTATQLRYICNGNWNHKFFALPHSYDKRFYPEKIEETTGKRIKLRYIGYSDTLRSLKPIVQAVKRLKEENFECLEKLDIEFIGNIPGEIRDMIMNFYLYDYIKVLPSVDYYESLKLMQEADWLIHVDAFFYQISTGGSIFFAGKIADYMGADKPILAFTGKESPADTIIKQYGGICCPPYEIAEIEKALKDIANGFQPEINEEYRNQYNAVTVAKNFDNKVSELNGEQILKQHNSWPVCPENHDDKLLTICIPSYNVARYLYRCIASLVDYKLAGYTEVLVIDDGSKDNTSAIAKEFVERYKGIVYLYTKENGGHGSTINYALKHAKGKYFRVVDGDDWVDSKQLNQLLSNIMEKNINADVISSNYHEVDIDTATLTPVQQKEDIEFYKSYTFNELKVENIYLTLASMMIKTSVLKEMNMSLHENTFYVDVEFILYPVPFINSILFTEEYIYKYARGNAEQSVALPNMVKRYDHHTRVMESVLKYGNNVSLDEGQKKYYDAILKRLLLTQYALGLVYDKNKKRGYKRIGEFDKFLLETRKDLYKWIPRKMRIVTVCRRYDFDYKKVKNSLTIFLEKKGSVAVHGGASAVRWTLSTPPFQKLMVSSLGRTAAKSKFLKGSLDKILNL